ncbi:AraC family transcriptional regulator [Zobellia barbeyronii]|uniref:Helix-turn-helix transcriptional regulator n=1 Tax=Zobellia barbeyronii TaxID=2748009 RepID=A0ABS5WBI2_9FLAO|nr:AraC family transcriptional regulator [Zobellia barbeyronii]MBT2160758.1 helix-turn-helix transcriptional regulator [Zobellia barbeyronii]
MKVHPFQIPKPLHQNLIVQVDREMVFYDKLHQHAEIQLTLIVKAKGKLIVGDSIHPFEDGDFFVIGPHSPHLFKNDSTDEIAHRISLFFTETTFGESFFELPDLEELQPLFNVSKEGFQVLGDTKDIQNAMKQLPNLQKLERFICFFNLLKNLCYADKKTLTNFVSSKKMGSSQGERMQTIFDYVVTHFQYEINLDTVSSKVHMTPNAFCKFFKQHTNKTFFQFLIELRIEHACQLLNRADDQNSILEISEQSGFSSISNFNRQFKKLKGVIPSRFAAQHKSKKSIQSRI